MSSEPNLRTFQRELPVKLNDHEIKMYGRQLAEKTNEKALLVERKTNWNKDANAGIQKVNVEIARLATATAKGEELRPVQCGERFANGLIEIVRLDRNLPEIVEVRPADMRDLQPDLPGVDEGGVENDGEEVGPDGEDEEPPPGMHTSTTTGDTTYVGDPEDRDPDVESEFDGLNDDEPEPGADSDEDETEAKPSKADRKAAIAERAKKRTTPRAGAPRKSGGKRKR